MRVQCDGRMSYVGLAHSTHYYYALSALRWVVVKWRLSSSQCQCKYSSRSTMIPMTFKCKVCTHSSMSWFLFVKLSSMSSNLESSCFELCHFSTDEKVHEAGFADKSCAWILYSNANGKRRIHDDIRFTTADHNTVWCNRARCRLGRAGATDCDISCRRRRRSWRHHDTTAQHARRTWKSRADECKRCEIIKRLVSALNSGVCFLVLCTRVLLCFLFDTD